MPRTIQKKVRTAKLAKGWHDATVTQVEELWGVPTKSYKDPNQIELQDKLVIHFGIQNGEDEPVIVKRRCNRTIGSKSTFGQFVQDITGEHPGHDYDIDSLEGQPCQVYITIREKDGDEWENVDRVMPAK